MRIRTVATLGLGLIATSAMAADRTETWTPATHTAESLGRVQFSPTSLVLHNGAAVQLLASGTVRFQPDYGAPVQATVYKVTGQDDPRRRGKAGLCDTSPVAFVLVWQPARTGGDINPRAINAFKGPRLTSGSPDDCGRFEFEATPR